jgi:hypothetical protein
MRGFISAANGVLEKFFSQKPRRDCGGARESSNNHEKNLLGLFDGKSRVEIRLSVRRTSFVMTLPESSGNDRRTNPGAQLDTAATQMGENGAPITRSAPTGKSHHQAESVFGAPAAVSSCAPIRRLARKKILLGCADCQ